MYSTVPTLVQHGTFWFSLARVVCTNCWYFAFDDMTFSFQNRSSSTTVQPPDAVSLAYSGSTSHSTSWSTSTVWLTSAVASKGGCAVLNSKRVLEEVIEGGAITYPAGLAQ